MIFRSFCNRTHIMHILHVRRDLGVCWMQREFLIAMWDLEWVWFSSWQGGVSNEFHILWTRNPCSSACSDTRSSNRSHVLLILFDSFQRATGTCWSQWSAEWNSSRGILGWPIGERHNIFPRTAQSRYSTAQLYGNRHRWTGDSSARVRLLLWYEDCVLCFQ